MKINKVVIQEQVYKITYIMTKWDPLITSADPFGGQEMKKKPSE